MQGDHMGKRLLSALLAVVLASAPCITASAAAPETAYRAEADAGLSFFSVPA